MNWIYEVNLKVDADIKEAYLDWLRPHIQEMLALPSFSDARLFADQDDQWVVQYHAPSREAIDQYINDHAKKMRGDGVNRFAGKFSATRRILRPLE